MNSYDELSDALTNLREGEAIFIKEGEYGTLGTSVTFNNLPPCTITGDNPILNDIRLIWRTNVTVEINNINFKSKAICNNICFDGDSSNIIIHHCTFNDMGTSCPEPSDILVTKSTPESSLEVYNCTFTGCHKPKWWGYSCASILYMHVPTVYNVYIHHNTFNHTKSSQTTVHCSGNGQAIAFINQYNKSSLSNVICKCNQYLGQGDTTKIGYEESPCE